MTTPLMERLVRWLAHATRPSRGRWMRVSFMLVVFLLPFIVLIPIGYVQLKETITDALLREAEVAALSTAVTLDERLDRIVDVGISYSTHPNLRASILEGAWEDTIENLELFHRLSDELFIDRIFLADATGTLTAGFPETGTEGIDFSYRDWYQGLLAAGGPYVSEVYTRAVEPQYNVVAVSVPVRSDSGELAAMMVLQARADHFLDWVEAHRNDSDRVVYIVDQTGKVVAHPQADPQGGIIDVSDTPPVQNVLAGERGVMISYSELAGSTVVSAYAPIAEHGWGAVVESPHSSFFASRDSSLRMLLAVFAVVLLFFMFLFYLFIKSLAHFQNHRDAHADAGRGSVDAV